VNKLTQPSFSSQDNLQHKETLLLVDDDVIFLKLLTVFFQGKGYEVATACNGQEALDYIISNSVDLMILDQGMGSGISGLELLQKLHTDGSDVGVVMLSGNEEAGLMHDVLISGALDFIEKSNGSAFWIKLAQAVKRALHVKSLEKKMHFTNQALLESEKRYRQIFVGCKAVLLILDPLSGRIIDANKAACQYYGYALSEMLKLHISQINMLSPDEIEAEMAQAVKEKRSHFFFVHRLKNGYLRDVEVHSGPIEIEGRGYLYSIVHDITERKIYEKQLRLAATVFDTTAEAIVVTDTKNRIQAVNPSFTLVTGYSEAEVIGRNPSFLASGRQDEAFYKRMWAHLSEVGRWQGEIWNRRKNGDVYAEWLSISAVKDEKGAICQYVAVFSDITKRKKAEELIKHQASFDALTNLPNRSLFLDRLGRAMMRGKRNNNQVALMFIDLDRFKGVNDSLGHNIGDLLLQEAAVRLSQCVRETDTVSRLGGDEFTIVLPDLTHGGDVEKVAQKALDHLSEPFLISGHEIFISGSVGITTFPKDGHEIESLMRNADTAMYRAKESGRNAYCFFTSEMNEESQNKMLLERDLRRAIEREEFTVYYQPVIDVLSGKVISAEALVRWQHPEKGLLAPGFFIALAEQTGLITQIGVIVLKQVCAQIKIWQSDPVMQNIRIAVNLSPHQLQNPNVVTDLTDMIKDADIPAQCLALEITETLVMQDPEGAAQLLEDIRSLGIKVYLDDFGTGYSSLNYLKRFSFDVLKIDRSFIMDVELDEGDAALVEAIIVMAHKLGIKVVAEGVETENQRKFVSAQSCDMIQGFYYSKPIPSEEFARYCIYIETGA
jgi:diguanylate cyclase (GGDEF)-like protein/PAS domain S-box-containing protein